MKKRIRKLVLNSETLRTLQESELARAAGGSAVPKGDCDATRHASGCAGGLNNN
jgi:hypothetical protein